MDQPALIADRLTVNVAGIELKTPVIAAAGTVNFAEEFAGFTDWDRVGAVAIKGLMLEPQSAGKSLAASPGTGGTIAAKNSGIRHFLDVELPQIRNCAVPILVNIAGKSEADFARLAESLESSGIAGLEVNAAYFQTGSLALDVTPESAARIIRTVKQHTSLPVIAKLSPNVSDITEFAKAVEDAGADAVSLINTLVGMIIDIHTWRPVFGNVMRELSGPAVKPLAVRLVWQTAQAVKIPVIGIGGIATASDAAEFLLAGATAVEIGTADFVNPQAVCQVTDGLAVYLASRGLSRVTQLVGRIRQEG